MTGDKSEQANASQQQILSPGVKPYEYFRERNKPPIAERLVLAREKLTSVQAREQVQVQVRAPEQVRVLVHHQTEQSDWIFFHYHEKHS
jgi:hypothetical protein